jgi:hypothetical protein
MAHPAFSSGFPNVIGAIDCTHIKIQAPHEFEEVYVCRKSIHSINVQVCIIVIRYVITSGSVFWHV